MGIRSSVELMIQLGDNNSLNSGSLIVDASLEELLDTIARAKHVVGDLDPEEVNVQIDKGDITTIRLLYIEANGDLDFYLGGVAATTAELTGSGASFPSGFSGGEELDVEIDGVSFTVEFESGDQSIAQVVARCNAASALAGLDGFTCFQSSGQLRFRSLTTGTGSTVAVTGGAGTPTTLGFAADDDAAGVDPTPATSAIRLRRNADPAGSQIESLKAYALMSVSASSIYVSNPSTEDTVRYRIAFGGDLVDPEPC